MKLVGQRIRSKATYQLGKIIKTSQLHIWITFNRNDDEGLKLTYDKFLELCYTSESVVNEVKERIEKQRILQPNQVNG